MIFRLKEKLTSDGTFAMQGMLLLRQGSMISIAILMSKCFLINDIGEVESLQYLLTTFSVCWINGLLQWFLPAFQHTPQEERNAFLWRVFFTFCILSAAVFLLFILEKNFLISFFLQKKPFAYSNIFFVYGLLFLPTYLLEYFLFVKKKYSNILIFSLLTFFFQNIAVLIAWYFNWGIVGIFSIWAIWAIFRFIACIFLLFPIVNANWFSKINFKSLLTHPAMPLIAYAFMAQWAITFNGWLVNYRYGGETLFFAIFRYGAREFPIVLALSTGLSAAAGAAISQDFSEGILLLKNKSLRLLHLLFPLTLLLLLSSQFWFPLVFSKAFSESVIIFDIFLLLIISRLLFPQTVAIGIRENKVIFYISLIELFINIIASSIFVNFWGLAGIAAGTWLAGLAEKLMIAFYLYKRHQININSYTPLLMWLLYSIILLFFFGVKYA